MYKYIISKMTPEERKLYNDLSWKKDKKYLEGVPLMPETENYELEPTYYYYKVKYVIKAMGMAYFPLGLHKLKAIMQLFLKNGLE